jgi:hypothetical protein
MICANPNCNKEIIGRRSDAHSCSLECSKKVKWIREKAKNIDRSEYIRKHYLNNKEKIKKRLKEYEFKNKERIALRRKLQRIRDCEQYKKISKEAKKRYRENNKERYTLLNREQCAKRRAKLLKAIPKFANLNKIKKIYKNCPKGYHVDHIIPLNNPIVCGLHVEWNLQYLSAKDNCSKGNKLIF